MKKLAFAVVFLISFVCLFAQAKDPFYTLTLGGTITVTTATGVELPAWFGTPEENYAVFHVTGLKPGAAYMAALTYDGGTDIHYVESWVDGNPFGRDWRPLGGVGSGTGDGEKMPGYESWHLFTTDPKSTRGAVFFVVRSSKPWTVTLAVTEANPDVDWLTKNKYGYFAVDDWTSRGTATFLLTRD